MYELETFRLFSLELHVCVLVITVFIYCLCIHFIAPSPWCDEPCPHVASLWSKPRPRPSPITKVPLIQTSSSPITPSGDVAQNFRTCGCILSQPNDVVWSSEESASKMLDLVISTCEIKSLGGWRLSMSNRVEGIELVNVELKYLLKCSALSWGWTVTFPFSTMWFCFDWVVWGDYRAFWDRVGRMKWDFLDSYLWLIQLGFVVHFQQFLVFLK